MLLSTEERAEERGVTAETSGRNKLLKVPRPQLTEKVAANANQFYFSFCG